MAKTALEKQLDKQIKQAKNAQRMQEKEARQAAIREQASIIIKDRPVVNGMRILDETAEEVLQCLLSCERGEGNRIVFDYDIFPIYLQHGMPLEFEKLVQYGMITGLMLHLNGGWLNLLPPAITYFENKKDLSISQGSTDTESVTTINSIKLKKGTVVKTAFDEYTLIKQIGLGGNGRVFSAKNKNGSDVAIKFVDKNVSTDKLQRFKNEIHFCEFHKHKNIVRILDRGYILSEDKDYGFYVMPLYLDTLRDKINKGLSPEQAISIFTGLLEGLSYAHKNGTIHRDIKPENIMFEADNVEPIICDFGIAHFAEEELLTIIETKKGDRMANFQYSAPEQRVKGIKSTPQTDIYALALILNEMFTHEIPQSAGHKTIASVQPEYKFLDDIFSQMFKQNPEERLYPEEKIMTEMKVLIENNKREKEKAKLQEVIDQVTTPEDFEVAVISKEYKNGSLIFTFNQNVPHEWTSIISNNNLGSYSCLWGYEPDNIEVYENNAIGIPVRGNESEETIRSIVTNVLEWVQTANRKYNAKIKNDAKEIQRRKEEQRKKEIAQIERDNKISSFLATL